MKILLLTLLFMPLLTISIWANERKTQIQESYKYESTKIDVTWKLEEGLYVTRLKINEKTIEKWYGSFVSDKFLRSQLIDRFLIMVWLKGVHGERVSVYDVKYKKFIWSFNSTWPINILKDDKQFSIEYFDEIQNEDRSFRKFTKMFPF